VNLLGLLSSNFKWREKEGGEHGEIEEEDVEECNSYCKYYFL
jgi:hypothetical protein